MSLFDQLEADEFVADVSNSFSRQVMYDDIFSNNEAFPEESNTGFLCLKKYLTS